jgi:hypothetical protein
MIRGQTLRGRSEGKTGFRFSGSFPASSFHHDVVSIVVAILAPHRMLP